MYPSNRMNPSAPPNMQGLLNSGIAPNFNMGNGTSHGSGVFYMNDRMAAGSSSVEHMSAQPAVGSFCPHPAVHVGSEAEHLQPLCGSGAGSLVESNYGRANHFTDVGRRVSKRKNLEDISGHSSYDGPAHSFNWEEGSSSRFTGPIRHDMGNVSSFSASGVTPVRVREWEELVVPRPGLMVGSSRAADYRNSALPVTPAMEGAQRSVRSRSNPSRYQEPNILHLRPSGNHARHFQARSHSSVEQPANMDPAETGANAIMHDTCQFPTSSSFQRRNLVLGGWNENMPRASSHFSSIATERDRPASLHSATSSSSTVTGVPNQGWYMSGADNRLSNDDLWTPMNRNMSGTTYTAQISAGPVLNSRTSVPWRRPQSLHMQSAGANSGLAQESVASLRPGQNNHFSRPSGPLAPPLDMLLNPAAGLQGPHYLRSSVEHRDQNARPLIRSIFDVSFERLQTLQNGDGGHNRIMAEDVLLFERSAYYGSVDLYDRHRDMRLDVDNMTYEELLALGERIGNVSTGLTDESFAKCLKIRTYSSSTESSAADETSQKCSICQEEYEDKDDLGTLQCGHDHHTECIKQWLLQKNECPICKAPALKK